MSNQAVGGVYQTIIDEVINSSRVDFEENGVEESVLEELRQGWQLKLSKLDVARFPWDPKPEETPAPQQNPPPPPPPGPSHSQAQFSPQLPLPTGGTPGTTSSAAQNGVQAENGQVKQEPGVQVKQEPGTQAVPQYQNYNGMESANSIAASRAAQQLQAQYGNRAAGSINAIQDRLSQQPAQTQPQPPQPPHSQPQMPTQGQQQPGNGSSSLANGQTDGAADADEDGFEGVLLRRGPAGDTHELGRVEIDRMLHEQIAAKAKSMEGGGLMLPLKEATRHRARGRNSNKGKGVAPFDGGDDDEEEDQDDLINSDLDDPESDNDDDEVDDEGLSNIMLCMYDKVQRVKNKWKCTLKDGVLTVKGKEYVFHKATGEYEW